MSVSIRVTLLDIMAGDLQHPNRLRRQLRHPMGPQPHQDQKPEKRVPTIIRRRFRQIDQP
jgi:hypothetical protein